MSECPKCNSQRIVSGRPGNVRERALFRPGRLRSFTVTLEIGVRFGEETFGCLDCGLVWGWISADKLRVYIQNHCGSEEQIFLGQCLKCRSDRVARGKVVSEHFLPAVFRPDGLRAFTFTLGGARFTEPAFGCLKCGFAWSGTSAEKLRKLIRKHCDPTPANAAAFRDDAGPGCSPSSGWREMWIGGVAVALVPFGYGVYCLHTGHAWFLQRRGPFLDLQGTEAVVLGIAYMGLGAYLHFRYFWGRHPRLRTWSPRLEQGALLVFIGGLGYTALRHLF